MEREADDAIAAGRVTVVEDVDELLAHRSVAVAAGRRAAALLREDVTPVVRLIVSSASDAARNPSLRLDERAAGKHDLAVVPPCEIDHLLYAMNV